MLWIAGTEIHLCRILFKGQVPELCLLVSSTEETMSDRLWFLQNYNYIIIIFKNLFSKIKIYFLDKESSNAPEPSKPENSTEPAKTTQQEEHEHKDGKEDVKWVNSIIKCEDSTSHPDLTFLYAIYQFFKSPFCKDLKSFISILR